MGFRYEWKYVLHQGDADRIARRLSLLLNRDTHAAHDGSYRVTSVYFDDHYGKVLTENIDGSSEKTKYRLRTYDRQSFRFEIKEKRGTKVRKIAFPVEGDHATTLLKGNLQPLFSDSEVSRRTYLALRTGGLRPRTTVEYRREAFVHPSGNVRITLDSSLAGWAAVGERSFLRPSIPFRPLENSRVILEIKYDAFLPGFLQEALALPDASRQAFSKYLLCSIATMRSAS